MNIIIYGTPTCNWCKEAKKLCEYNFIEYDYRDLTTMKAVDANNVVHWAGMKSVPIIYDGTALIGGYDAFKKYLEGKKL